MKKTSLTEIASPILRQALQEAARKDGFLSWRDFSGIALYHPEAGYYIKEKVRVGRRGDADFFTSSSFRELFRMIAIEATDGLLATIGLTPAQAEWLEIGAEPGAALIGEGSGPFASARAAGSGQELKLGGVEAVFSNELFDAQPFHSVAFRGGAWRELGWNLEPDGLAEADREIAGGPLERYLADLPRAAPEGYRVDLPTGACEILERILAQPWSGSFIALDYGKTWQAMAYDTPQGSARAYRAHRQEEIDLRLAGDQDLTVHICWDWLEDVLRSRGFENIRLMSQEAFVVRQAPLATRRIVEEGSSIGSPLKSQLRQLIHPALMGQKFQALLAVRR